MCASLLSRALTALAACNACRAEILARIRATPMPPIPWLSLIVEADAANPVPGAHSVPPPHVPEPTLALRIRPPVDAPQDLTAMEMTIQALTRPGPARTSAIALELVGMADARALVVRATSKQAIDTIARQLQARYPQADLHHLTLDQDAFCLHDNEAVRARELRPNGPSYLSLRTWNPPRGGRQEYQQGVDPLLGILAAVWPLPDGMRVVTQIALIPAPPNWSNGHLHEADQYSLARSRIEAVSRDRQSQIGGLVPVIMLFLLVLAGWWLLLPSHHADHLPFIGPFVQHLLSILFPTPGEASSQRPGSAILNDVTRLLPTLVGGIIGVAVCGWFLALLLSKLMGGRREKQLVLDPNDIALKAQQPGYRARLRLFVFSPEGATKTDRNVWRERRRQVLDQLTSAYRQFDRAGALSFAPRPIPRWWATHLVPESPYWEGDRIRRDRHWTGGIARSPVVFSLAEVASLWHLPQAIDLPEIPWLEQQTRGKTLFAPRSVMAEPGGDPLQVIGTSRHANHTTPITLHWDNLRQHSLMVAKTGKGKSSLMLLLARLGLATTPTGRAGEPVPRHISASKIPVLPQWDQPGLILIDPHGDLAVHLMGVIPESRRNDVIVLDLADTEHPPAFNPLDVTLGQDRDHPLLVTPHRDRDKVVADLLLIFADLWEKGWGYRMENAMEFALKTLYAANETLVFEAHGAPDEQFTLLDVAPLLTLTKFRETTLLLVKDTIILDWWHTYFDHLYDRLRLDVINPVLTKVSKFSSAIIARRILGGPQSSIDLANIIRNGKILIVNTAQGVVGTATARLISATLLGLLRVTLEEQAAVSIAERRRFLVLVDEFQTLQGVDFGAMLSELRKFGASFLLATQALAYLDKLDPTLRSTVMANIDNLYAFSMSADDARLIERELDGVVTTRDLINLDAFTCYAKLTLNGRRLPVFSLTLATPPIPDPSVAQTLREQCRPQIAPRSLASIDALLEDLAKRHPPEEKQRRSPLPGGAPLPPTPVPPQRSVASQAAARHKQHPLSASRTNFTDHPGTGSGFPSTSASLTTSDPPGRDPDDNNPQLPGFGHPGDPPRRPRGKRGSGKGTAQSPSPTEEHR